MAKNSEITEKNNQAGIENKEFNNIYPRSLQINQNQLIQEIKGFLGVDLIKQEFTESDHTPIFQISKKRIISMTQFMVNLNYQLDGIFGVDKSATIELFYLFSNGEYLPNSEILIFLSIDKKIEMQSINLLIPPAKYYEKNITYRLGLNFLNPIELNGNFQDIMHVPLDFSDDNVKNPPFLHGIFDPVHKENPYHLISRDPKSGIVRSVSLRTGWKYKKTQPKLENSAQITEFLSILQEISPLSNVHLTLGFFLNLEKIKGIDLVNKVSHIRTLLAELERAHSHLVWFANLAALLGLNLFAKRFKKIVGKIEALNEAHFGHPLLFNTISLGTAMDLPADKAQQYLHNFNHISKKISDLLLNFTSLHTTHVLLRDVGMVSAKNAILWGLTGPSLRASNHLIDTRNSNPYLSYHHSAISQNWEIIGSTSGDSFARCLVRKFEIEQSMKIIVGLLKGLSNYLLPVPAPKSLEGAYPPSKTVLTSVEAPHGKMTVIFKTDSKENSEKLHTVRILTPDYRNFCAIPFILKGTEPEDISIILHSLDLDYDLVDL